MRMMHGYMVANQNTRTCQSNHQTVLGVHRGKVQVFWASNKLRWWWCGDQLFGDCLERFLPPTKRKQHFWIYSYGITTTFHMDLNWAITIRKRRQLSLCRIFSIFSPGWLHTCINIYMTKTTPSTGLWNRSKGMKVQLSKPDGSLLHT